MVKINELPNFNDFFQIPEINKLLANWSRVGDRILIAENENRNIGAAWYRLWTKENPSFGFVDAETPELGIGIREECRSKGFGRDY